MNQDPVFPEPLGVGPALAPSASADRALPPERVRIRPMQASDLEAVKQIDRMSFTLPWPENAYRYELFENPGSRLWVAEVESPEGKPIVVGVIVVWLILDEAHIATLAVHPDYRRCGLARELLATALRAVIRLPAEQTELSTEQAEIRLATLEVRASNLAAQRLYHHFGFETVGNRPRYYRDNNEDALIMTVTDFDKAYLHWLENYSYRTSPAPRRLAVSGAAP